MLSFHVLNIIPGFVELLQAGGISQGKPLPPPSAPEAPETQAGTVLPLSCSPHQALSNPA